MLSGAPQSRRGILERSRQILGGIRQFWVPAQSNGNGSPCPKSRPLDGGGPAVWVGMIDQDFPKTELEFHAQFATEDACREYWMKVRWPQGIACRHCGCKNGKRRSGREEWQCASCRKETSPRAGTVLHNSPKPIRAWLLAMFHMSVNKQGISALRLQKLMGFGCYETALRWLRELRRVLAAVEASEKLGQEVEVDETLLGGVEEGGKGPFQGKVLVVGAVEKKGAGCGRVRLRALTARNVEQLCGFVEDVVARGTIVATDGYQCYAPLAERGFFHDPRTTTNGKGGNSSQLKVESGQKIAAVHLPRIHKVFSLVERIVLGAFQGSVSEKHLQSYLDEYCFRFNRRTTSAPLGIFQQVTARAVASQCIPLWRSRGRIAPDKPLQKRNNEWVEFAALLEGVAYVG
jgi:transposase-like protein